MSEDKDIHPSEDDGQSDDEEKEKYEEIEDSHGEDETDAKSDYADRIRSMSRMLGSYGAIQKKLSTSFMPNYNLAKINAVAQNINGSFATALKMQASTENLVNMFKTPAWMKTIESIRGSLNPAYLNSMSALTNSLNRLGIDKTLKLSDAISNAFSKYTLPEIQMVNLTAPIQKWIALMYRVKDPFEGIAEKFRERREQLKEIIIVECYDAKWFPQAVFDLLDADGLSGFLGVLEHTRKSKSRVKKLDGLILSYYDDKYVEAQKKSWRNLGLPEYMTRIFHQAVQAFHRKEYAITVIVLSTFWEGIINRKSGVVDGTHVNSRDTKENFKGLVEENGSEVIISSFYDEYIMYQYREKADLIDDVPGRHGVAHGAYNGYPSRKAALNAILFTDFLLKLEPAEE